MAGVTPAETGSASGSLGAIQQLAGSVGVAALATLYAATSHPATRHPTIGHPTIGHAATGQAAAHGLAVTALATAVLLGAGAVLTLLLPAQATTSSAVSGSA